MDLLDFPPMLLDERTFALGTPGWVYEIKFDGYRLLAEFGSGHARLRTRGGTDATAWFPEVARSLSQVPGGPHIADGEVCVLDSQGRSDFDRLHDRAKRRGWRPGVDEVTFCPFDLLYEVGTRLMHQPLEFRKARLLLVFAEPLANVLPLSHFESDQVQWLFDSAVLPLKLEGLVAKRLGSSYVPGARSVDWVKVKRRGAIRAERFRKEPVG